MEKIFCLIKMRERIIHETNNPFPFPPSSTFAEAREGWKPLTTFRLKIFFFNPLLKLYELTLSGETYAETFSTKGSLYPFYILISFVL